MGNIFANLDWSILTDALIRIVPALLCLTIHELCHGLIAYKLGDNTAKNMGRLTLNPLKHIDIIGLIMMALFRFGWAKPVPVDMRNFKHPKRGMALTALAGPVSNFVFAAIILAVYGVIASFLPYNYGKGWGTALELILDTAWLSVALGVFNLIPIPPLDGSKVLFSLLGDEAYLKLMRIERFGMIILMIVLFTNVLDKPLVVVTSWMFERLLKIAIGIYNLLNPLVN